MIYTHYKGSDYFYLSDAVHTETSEKLSVYKDEDGKVWARPYDMFHGTNELGQIRFMKRGETMEKLFELVNRVAGESIVYRGLYFDLPNGVVIIDIARGVEIEDGKGGTEIVDGYVIDYAPYADVPAKTFFALDEEGVDHIINEVILQGLAVGENVSVQ